MKFFAKLVVALALAGITFSVGCTTSPGGPPKPDVPPVTEEELAAEAEREMAWYDCLARVRRADPFCTSRGLICYMANSDRRDRHDKICRRFMGTR